MGKYVWTKNESGSYYSSGYRHDRYMKNRKQAADYAKRRKNEERKRVVEQYEHTLQNIDNITERLTDDDEKLTMYILRQSVVVGLNKVQRKLEQQGVCE